MYNISQLRIEIENFCKNELNFDLVGFTNKFVDEKTKNNYKLYLKNNYNSKMKYLENNLDIRLNPKLLFEDYESMIVLGLNYHDSSPKKGIYKHISNYSYGRDYHKTVKSKLKKLSKFLEEKNIKSRAFVDSAPLLEKYFAIKAGLGWQGKNGLIINKKIGSKFFIGELLVDIDLGSSKEQKNYCGTCTKCIDACPTKAIKKEKLIDSNLCIAYLTIENREVINEKIHNKISNYIFGCDICQDVCPFNKKLKNNDNSDFKYRYENLELKDLINITKKEFDDRFKGSVIKRAKFENFVKRVKKLI